MEGCGSLMMTNMEAFKIVLDLAWQNTINQCLVSDPELVKEQNRQDEALELFAKFIENMGNK